MTKSKKLAELIGEEEADGIAQLIQLAPVDLSDMPAQMTKEDYARVFARVISPQVYQLILAACVGRAVSGNIKAIELIMNQAQGTPTPRQGEETPQNDALIALQRTLMLAGQRVEYSVIENS